MMEVIVRTGLEIEAWKELVRVIRCEAVQEVPAGWSEWEERG